MVRESASRSCRCPSSMKRLMERAICAANYGYGRHTRAGQQEGRKWHAELLSEKAWALTSQNLWCVCRSVNARLQSLPRGKPEECYASSENISKGEKSGG